MNSETHNHPNCDEASVESIYSNFHFALKLLYRQSGETVDRACAYLHHTVRRCEYHGYGNIEVASYMARAAQSVLTHPATSAVCILYGNYRGLLAQPPGELRDTAQRLMEDELETLVYLGRADKSRAVAMPATMLATTLATTPANTATCRFRRPESTTEKYIRQLGNQTPVLWS